MKKLLPLQNTYKIIIGFVIVGVLIGTYFLLGQYKTIHTFSIEEDVTILKKDVGVSVSAGTKVSINKVFGDRSLGSIYDIILEKNKKGVFKIGDKASNIHFSKPIKILFSTNLPNGTKVKVEAKHVGESTFSESGLTKTIDTTCIEGIPTIGADLSTVHENQVIIYTCSLSEFIIEPAFIVGSGSIGFDQTVNVVHHLPDNSMLIGGGFTSYKGVSTNGNGIVKLLPNGEIDTGYLIPQGTIANVNEIAVQNDGKILVGATALVRLNSDGSIDNSFQTESEYENSGIESILILPDDKILIGGSFVGGIKLLNPDGSENTGSELGYFGSVYGYSYDAGPWVMQQQTDGKILIGGRMSYYYDTNDIPFNSGGSLIRLNADLTFDTGFNAAGQFSDVIHDILIQEDDKIIVGGDFTNYGATPIYKIARLFPDGLLDTDFIGENEGILYSHVSALAQDNNGKILVGGMFNEYSGHVVNGIMRLEQNGELDMTFGLSTGGGLSNGGQINDISIDSNQNIVLGGQFTEFAGRANVSNIIRLNNNGADDRMFSNNIKRLTDLWSNPPFIQKIQKYSNEKILLFGQFSFYDGYQSKGIVRLNPDLSFDNTFVSPFELLSFGLVNYQGSIIQSDGKIILGGQMQTQEGTGTISTIIRLFPNGNIDTSFILDETLDNLISNCGIKHMKQLSDGKILVGHCYTSRINADGTLDQSFDISGIRPGSGSNFSTLDIGLQSDGKFIQIHENKLTRFFQNGDIDTSFNRLEIRYYYEDNGEIQEDDVNIKILVGANGNILVGGYFNKLGDDDVLGFVRLKSNGDIDESFVGPDIMYADVRDIIIDNEGYIYIAGYFHLEEGEDEYGAILMKLLPNGVVNDIFPLGNDNGNSPSVVSILLYSDTELLIGGVHFNTYNGLGVSEAFIKVTDIDPPVVIPPPAAPTITYPASGTVLSETGSVVIRGTGVANMGINITLSGVQYEGTITSTGFWQITSLQLGRGTYTVSAIVTNSIYNKTSPATTSLFIIQTELSNTGQVTPPAPSQGGGGGGGGASTPSIPSAPTINQSIPSIMLPSAGFPLNSSTGSSGSNTINGHTLLLEALQSDREMQTAYEFAYENKMTRSTLENKQTLYAPLTREELARIMSAYIKTVDKKSIPQNSICELEKYQDYRAINRSYRVFVIEMCNLGLLGVKSDGTPIAIYNPKGIVTRAELSTILSRYLYGKRYNRDGEDWYLNHMNALKNNGIIKTSTAPTQKEIRGFMFIMLHRIHSYN